MGSPLARERTGSHGGSRAPWLLLTARAVAWWPLAVVAPVLGVAAGIAGAAEAGPISSTLLGVALALLAAATLLGLDDPARDLLAAMPTTLVRRRAQRLALLGPAVLGLSATLLLSGRHLDLVVERPSSALGSVAALLTVGLLAGRVAERRRAELVAPVAAGTPVAWVLLAAALPARGVLGGLAHGWAERPWLWVVGAIAALVLVHGGEPR